jgi:molybdopterin biosynthesis enzyme
VVRKEDIPALINLGKRHLFVLHLSASQLHEDEAALRIAAAVSGPGLRWTEPSEGKSSMLSLTDGLLKIDVRSLLKINRMGEIILSTLKNNFPCRRNQVVAATRIIPLTVKTLKIERLERIAAAVRPLITVRPFRHLKVGAVVTGTEIFDGAIPDGFDAHVAEKIRRFGSTVAQKILAPDHPARIAAAIEELRGRGCELIVTTGGLSVDPDDVTRKGVLQAGARIVAYGSPVLPGAMFLYALLDGLPILGLPACVYYHASTIFDLMLPRVLAGDPITRAEIAAMGHGGLCLNCEQCRFPACPFGK